MAYLGFSCMGSRHGAIQGFEAFKAGCGHISDLPACLGLPVAGVGHACAAMGPEVSRRLSGRVENKKPGHFITSEPG